MKYMYVWTSIWRIPLRTVRESYMMQLYGVIIWPDQTICQSEENFLPIEYFLK